MHPDLQRLIQLQQLDTAAEQARRRIAEEPERREAIDARLAGVRDRVAAAKQQLAESQAARRAAEKEVAVVQTRLSKFKDQLMAVKTNREYQAMQKEIEVAEHEVRAMEDRILERMIQADELAAAVKRMDAELAAEERAATAERQDLEGEVARLQAELERSAAARERVIAEIDAPALALFEHVARQRKGVAVAEARNGLCTVCHLRLRPQVFNEVRQNAAIIQCENCHRILYFAPETQAQASEVDG